MAVFTIYKPLGATPLETIRVFRNHNPLFEKNKIAYAGRLDPMAEGLLILLTDEDCKNRTHYERLRKKYRATFLLGLESDTYDVLGIVSKTYALGVIPDRKSLESYISKLPGKYSQPYPPYSSARVNGKPLFYWARHNKLDTITVPSKNIEILETNIEDVTTIPFSSLIKMVRNKISHVTGDFRQDSVLKSWGEITAQATPTCTLLTVSITCTSGTYVRSLANSLGKDLKIGALLFSLERTHVGDYSVSDALSYPHSNF